MSESTNQIDAVGGNPFDLAAMIASQVELEAIFLTNSQTWRRDDLELPEDVPNFVFEISQTSHGKDIAQKRVYVKITFISHDSFDKLDKPAIYRVEATFMLVYEIKSFHDIEEKNFWAFSVTTGIYNAWPYWREFLQNTTTRMGLPPVVAPPFRFEPKNAGE